MEVKSCSLCDEPLDTWNLFHCPICYKLVCEECSMKGFGQRFCSLRCRDYYWSADEDFSDEEYDETDFC